MPISRIKTDGINDDAITSAKIGVDVIVADDLAANSVTVSEITDGAVTGAKLADNLNYDSGTLYLDSTNNRVGIGTTSPSYKLDVVGNARLNPTSNPVLRFAENGTLRGLVTSSSSTGLSLETSGTLPFILQTNSAERLRVDGSGNVGIGLTTPVARLEIKKTVSTTGSMTDTALHLTTDATTGRKLNIGFGLGGGVANTNAAVIGFDVTSGTGATEGDLFFSTRSGTSDSVPTERLRIESDGKIKIGNNIPMWSGSYGGGLFLKGNNATGDRYAQLAIVDSTGAIAHQGLIVDTNGGVNIGGIQTNAGAKLSVISDSVITSGSNTTDEGIVMIPSASLSSNQYSPWISWTAYSSSTAPQRGRAGIGAISTNNASALELIFATRNAADGSVLSPADEKMRLTTGGQLCLNKTSDSLNDSSGISLNGAAGLIRVERNNDPTLQLNRMSANGQIVQFFRGAGNQVGNITGNTSSVSYNTSSDYRLKENVEYDFDATTRLKQLKPARFNFIADADTTVDGFLAHEVQSIVPEAITGTHNEVDDEGNPVYQGIDQGKLVPLLVKTIQELEARITALESN